jgi:hypothetical protein
MNRYLILCGQQYIRIRDGGEPVYGTCVVVDHLELAARLDKRDADRYMAGTDPHAAGLIIFSVREAG